jgi:hypothetical protein
LIDKKAIWVTQETMTRFNGFGIRGVTADQLLNHLLDLAEKRSNDHGEHDIEAMEKAKVE